MCSEATASSANFVPSTASAPNLAVVTEPSARSAVATVPSAISSEATEPVARLMAKSTFAVPSKETPAAVVASPLTENSRAVSKAVAESALPFKSPVKEASVPSVPFSRTSVPFSE